MKLFNKIVSVLAALTVMSCAAVSSVYAVGTDTKIQLASDVQYSASRSFSTLDETADYLKEQIKLRNDAVNITVPYSFDQASDVLVEIMDKAFAETGNGDEGDYIRFGIHGYECSYSGNSARVTFNIRFYYFTTGEEERLVDEKVESILEELDLIGKSDYEKIEIIYDYIINNVSYAYNSSDDVIFSAYSALFNTLPFRHKINQTSDYFLRGSENFDEHNKTAPHIASSGKEDNDAYAPDYTSAEFTKKYPVSQIDYDPENDKITYSTGDVKPPFAVPDIILDEIPASVVKR